MALEKYIHFLNFPGIYHTSVTDFLIAQIFFFSFIAMKIMKVLVLASGVNQTVQKIPVFFHM